LAAVTSPGAGAAAALGGVGTVQRRDEKRREGAESGEGKAEARVFIFFKIFFLPRVIGQALGKHPLYRGPG